MKTSVADQIRISARHNQVLYVRTDANRTHHARRRGVAHIHHLEVADSGDISVSPNDADLRERASRGGEAEQMRVARFADIDHGQPVPPDDIGKQANGRCVIGRDF
jgi:hypothetical protein